MQLVALDLSNNKLTGTLPATWSSIRQASIPCAYKLLHQMYVLAYM